jgi:hypothetical protein
MFTARKRNFDNYRKRKKEKPKEGNAITKWAQQDVLRSGVYSKVVME